MVKFHSAKANLVPLYLCRAVTPSGREGKSHPNSLVVPPHPSRDSSFLVGISGGKVTPKRLRYFIGWALVWFWRYPVTYDSGSVQLAGSIPASLGKCKSSIVLRNGRLHKDTEGSGVLKKDHKQIGHHSSSTANREYWTIIQRFWSERHAEDILPVQRETEARTAIWIIITDSLVFCH